MNAVWTLTSSGYGLVVHAVKVTQRSSGKLTPSSLHTRLGEAVEVDASPDPPKRYS